jgi:hypothetical protein
MSSVSSSGATDTAVALVRASASAPCLPAPFIASSVFHQMIFHQMIFHQMIFHRMMENQLKSAIITFIMMAIQAVRPGVLRQP